MNKREYAEFHKYLALLIYDYNKILHSNNLCEESRNQIEEVLMALDKVMKICLIDYKEN